ncbi:Trm112 family protein [Planctomycetota bacterium]|nr:Trm112 family protein [Planctomycetota bacterium]
MSHTIDPKILNVLVCPLTRSKLMLEGDHLVAEKGGLKYHIRDGIPILLAEKAVLPDGINSLEEFKSKFADIIP